jgi:hypothetical protein
MAHGNAQSAGAGKIVLVALLSAVVAGGLVAAGVVLGARSHDAAAPAAASTLVPVTTTTSPGAKSGSPAGAAVKGTPSPVEVTTSAVATTRGAAPSSTASTASPHPLLVKVNWAKLNVPLKCESLPLDISERKFADVNSDGNTDEVVIASCQTPTGTPPDALYVFTGAPGPSAVPRLLTTLVPLSKYWELSDLQLGPGEVTVSVFAYSSPKVPNCCPDVQAEADWGWAHGKFVFQE